MKAFVLAAGQGVRLRPLTDTIPKCLVPIGGVPLLGIWLELCRRHGIDEVLINTHAHPNAMKRYIAQHLGQPRVRLSEERELLGSAGTLKANRDWINTDPFFWVFYGDVLTNANLKPMLEFHTRRRPVATLAVNEVPHPEQCGIVRVDHKQIVREFIEKPKRPPSNMAFSGIMVATTQIFDFIPNRSPADIGFDVLPKLVGRMVAYPIYDYLIDIGTPTNYEKAQCSWPGFSCL